MVAISKERLRQLAEDNMIGKVHEANLLLCKEGVLGSPVGMFRGVERPLTVLGSPDWYGPDQIVACIANPTVSARIIDDTPQTGTPAASAVFVTYLREIRDPGQRDQIRRELKADHPQVYLAYHWEWVKSDSSDPTLPDRFTTRYTEKLPCP